MFAMDIFTEGILNQVFLLTQHSLEVLKRLMSN